MVHVCMSDQDVTHGLTGKGLLQRCDMLGIVRSRINHGNVTLSDNVGAGSPKRECRGVFRQYASDHRTDLLTDLVFKVELVDEWDICHETYSISPLSAETNALSREYSG